MLNIEQNILCSLSFILKQQKTIKIHNVLSKVLHFVL